MGEWTGGEAMEWVLTWITEYGYVALFILLMLGIVGAPFPDDLILTFTGYLIFEGILHPVPAFVCAWTGSLCGITASYVLGRILGASVIGTYGPYVGLHREEIAKINRWYERLGKWTLFFGYFVAGVRHWTAFVAGMSKLRISVFVLFAFPGGFCWAATMMFAGYLLGKQWRIISEYLEYYVNRPAIAVAVVALVLGSGYLLMQRRRGQRSAAEKK
ncbi:MAG TPA: DedA family protein [Desulfomonilaceae bacterium]|nr:DedA family protein [Desulfomonilaceae bacterium]